MRREGFTVAEVAVALVIFAVLGLAAGHLLHAAAASAATADHRERLLWWATAVADSVGSGRLPGSGTRRLPGEATIRWQAGGPVQVIPGSGDSVWISLPVGEDFGTPALPAR